MTAKGTCPQCGTLLFTETAAGLCPRCLSSVGFAIGIEETTPVPPRLQRLGDYELIEEIARGGMGVVYKARQVSLDRTVAVKVVLHGPFSSPEFVKRFHTEAAVVARLQHPNIVAIHEVGQHGADHFFSMEYVDGQNLADLVREKPLTARRAATCVKAIAEAVQYAHQRGVLHRDLKPSNVLVDAADQPRIMDFGLAKLLTSDTELTSTGQVLGSPSYISPEQAAGKNSEYGPQSDLYSLGAILWTGAGDINVTGGAVITNRAGALFHAQNAAGLGGGNSNGRLDNAGTFRKSANPGITTFQSGMILNNSGSVEIQAGTLQLAGNGSAASGSATGTFDAAPTTLVEWSGGTFALNPGAQLNGSGLYRINGFAAILAANTDIGVERLDLAAGTLNGAGSVTIANAMTWSAGTMSGSGRTIIPPAATLNFSNAGFVFLTGRTLENGGAALWTGAGSIRMDSGAVITNRAGALFEVQSAGSFSSALAPNRIDNAGTFRKSVSTGTTTVPGNVSFNNDGTVDIRSGILAANGGYNSSSNALLNCALAGTAVGTGYGQLKVAGTVTLNGGLSVDLIPGFIPATSDTFTVLTAGTRNGTFASFNYPSNAVTMQLSNSPNVVLVRVAEVFGNMLQPTLLPPEISGMDFKLTWTAVSNTAYRVEFNPNLAPSNWTALPGDVTAVTNTASKLDPLTSSNRLYRVRVVP